jgi:diguanylate cyclase (GGDEF)-like protein
MSTVQRKAAQTPIRVNYPVGKLLATPSKSKNQLDQDDITRVLQITSVLQTTLEVGRIIELFSQELQSLVPHDGLNFKNTAEKYSQSLGTKAQNSCAYKLVIGDQSLGELTITRKKRFTARETLLMEYVLCSVVYPLRNALLYKQAINAALKDPLTGVNNRAAMEITVTREIDLAKRHGTPLSLIAMDIDRFKSVNDNYGHLAGDSIIKAVAETVNACIRSSDILFRYGGEEFAIVLSNTGPKGAILLAERIRAAISKKQYRFDRSPIGITVSQGVACLEQKDEIKSLFMKADAALYKAKADGRNCVKFDEKC